MLLISFLPAEFPANEDDVGDFASGEQQADEALGRVWGEAKIAITNWTP